MFCLAECFLSKDRVARLGRHGDRGRKVPSCEPSHPASFLFVSVAGGRGGGGGEGIAGRGRIGRVLCIRVFCC